jgi:replicative DNA helicase
VTKKKATAALETAAVPQQDLAPPPAPLAAVLNPLTVSPPAPYNLLPAAPNQPPSLAPTRQVPFNLEAEQALLATVMLNNRVYEQVSDFLLPDHFASGLHGRIFAAIGKLLDRQQLASPITLKPFFEQDPDIATVGGIGYLAELSGGMVSIINAVDYARLVHDLYLRRQLIAVGEEVVNRAHEQLVEQPALRQIEQAEQQLYDLASNGQIDGGFQNFETALTEAVKTVNTAFQRSGQLSGTSSGFRDLDALMGGLQKSDLLIVAGRPGMGKTALATNIAFYAAQNCRRQTDAAGKEQIVDGAVVGFFSLEMSAPQLATRILAEQTALSSEKIRRGELSKQDFDKIVDVSQRLHQLPFFIDDTPGMSISAIRTRARRLKRRHNLSLIIIDYLQLIQPNSTSRRENRVQEISETTRGLKTLAKELDVPVIALSQLSRGVEARDDKRPQLADLRESGSIEQDADAVLFVYREDYYLARSEPSHNDKLAYDEWRQKFEKIKNLAEVILAKHRHGPTGKVQLHFDGAITRFSDYQSNDHLPAAPF